MKQRELAKPFIKWAGGKRKLIPSFEAHFPKDLATQKNLTYIEPFVGGGAMLFYMLQQYPNISSAVINDVNPHLVNLYRMVQQQPAALLEQLEIIRQAYADLQTEEHRKNYYLHQRERFNTHRLNKVQEAACFMFLNRTCFNGLYRVNSKGMFNVPFGRYKNVALYDEKTLYEDSKLLQRVTILQGDFEATKVFANTNTLVYFDPPYRPLDATSNFTAYAKEPFGDEEQRRLKRYFDELHQRGCRLMLSNSDPTTRNANDDFFDALYRDYYIHRVYASRAINAKAEKCGKIAELFITNYPAVSHVTLKDNAYPSVSLKEKRYEPSPQQRTV